MLSSLQTMASIPLEMTTELQGIEEFECRQSDLPIITLMISFQVLWNESFRYWKSYASMTVQIDSHCNE
jgi:hypothetical protein